MWHLDEALAKEFHLSSKAVALARELVWILAQTESPVIFMQWIHVPQAEEVLTLSCPSTQ